jgi:hypothetical protein
VDHAEAWDSSAWTAELNSQDPFGNFFEPASAYSWLQRALGCLGRVKQAPQETLDEGTAYMSDIFSYGDAVQSELPDARTDMAPSAVSWRPLELLLTTYFERAAVTYRFLHLSSVRQWLKYLSQGNIGALRTTQTAICFLVLAHGALYLSDDEIASLPDNDKGFVTSEVLFQKARKMLSEETSPPTLESIQARLVYVHHLLSSSRPN